MANEYFYSRGDNSSYTIGVNMGSQNNTRAHLFVADLDNNGNVTAYICRYSSTVTSYQVDLYSGSSSSPFSQFKRPYIGYVSTNRTSYSTGQRITKGSYSTWDAAIRAADTAGATKYLKTDSDNYIPAAQPTTYDYYWQYQYYTKSTSRIIGTSSVYSETDVPSSAGYNIAVSDISAYSNTTKTNTYTPGRYCGYANGFFTIYTTSSQASPAICYVQVDINTFTWHGSDTMDNNLIKPLASIRTGLTATAWNRFNDIMLLVGNASQAGVETHKTTVGATVTADLLKSVLTELGKIESQQHTGITIVDPQTIVRNQTRVLASYFNGTNSIKDNLNNLVDSVNS